MNKLIKLTKTERKHNKQNLKKSIWGSWQIFKAPGGLYDTFSTSVGENGVHGAELWGKSKLQDKKQRLCQCKCDSKHMSSLLVLPIWCMLVSRWRIAQCSAWNLDFMQKVTPRVKCPGLEPWIQVFCFFCFDFLFFLFWFVVFYCFLCFCCFSRNSWVKSI